MTTVFPRVAQYVLVTKPYGPLAIVDLINNRMF